MQAPGMDIRSAQYLVAVVDHGSVTAAAVALHISQPSLSQAIRNLERTLGSALFDRTARGLIPTAAGAAVADAARKLLTDVAKAETAVAAVIALQSGELAIAVQSDLAVDAVADMAGQLHRTAPGIVFSTTAASSAREVRALVRSGRCELGFLERDLADGTSDNLREIETRAQETVLSIPPALAVGLPDPLPRASISALPMIVDAPSNRRSYPLGAEWELVDIVVEVPDRLAVREMVGHGGGAALLPRSIAEQDAPGTSIRSLHPPIIRRTSIVFRDGPLSPAAAALVSNLRTAHSPSTNSLPNGDNLSGSNSIP
ncbi:LysR family transcriptional regulator [Rhodococcus sp. KBS0724]|uniref:LysR family transcriptional regulator n=1 Tax=Rhodococcus sp. KBS0724 TaxID=1179674 RepID=UPI00110E1371|nr:LysR family transcriptional regulator [Rhodococcus sp. KBS0724]TSD49448.1 LysR family transcriptional regulator [Rhodococcus sp. KBS0724]